MWGRSSKQRKSAMSRRAAVGPLEAMHTPRLVGYAQMKAVKEAQKRAQTTVRKPLGRKTHVTLPTTLGVRKPKQLH